MLILSLCLTVAKTNLDCVTVQTISLFGFRFPVASTANKWDFRRSSMCDVFSFQNKINEAFCEHRWWEIMNGFYVSHLWECRRPLPPRLRAEIHSSSPFHPSQTAHPPTSFLKTKNRTGESQPEKLLSLNCHQFTLCSNLSVTLPQLWKTFIKSVSIHRRTS